MPSRLLRPYYTKGKMLPAADSGRWELISFLFFLELAMCNIIKKLLKWYKHDRFKMFHLETMLIEDHQWMAHNTIAKRLTERYLKALSEDWHRTCFPHVSRLRDELNCNPYNKTAVAIDKMKDHNVNLASELYQTLNDEQKRIFISGIRKTYDLTDSQVATMLQIKRSEILALFIATE